MEKFGRIYDMRISVKDSDKNISISNPFTLSFYVYRTAMPTANVGKFKLYNLPKNIRDQIRFDVSSLNQRQEIAVKAGYRSLHKNLNDLPLIFRGTIKYAYSERVGVDWITTIECYDGGFAIANSRIEETFIRGEKYRSAVEKVADYLDGIEIGTISPSLAPKDKTILRGHSVNGKIADILNENFGTNWTIDCGRLNIVADDEALPGILKVVNADTGLLGTPIRQKGIIDFNIVFEPRLLIHQLLTLQPQTDPDFNGTYKLIGFTHQGMISDAQCGEAITGCRVFKGTKDLKEIKQ